MNTEKNIAIIGAGMAGLTVALKLQQAGAKVTIFEKSRGVAGRMSTRRQAASMLSAPQATPFECDHGAPYFTANDSEFVAELASWQVAGVASIWTPRLKIFGQSSHDDLDVTTALQRETAIERYVGTPRMTSPAQHLAKALIRPVMLSTTIMEVAPHTNGTGWTLTSQEHGNIPTKFDTVLFAIPAPQALALLKTIAPDFASSASSAQMQGMWALMLHGDAVKYKSPDIDAAVIFNSPLKWVAREASKPSRAPSNTWCLLASPSWSEAHMEDSVQDVANALLAAFEDIGGIGGTVWTAHRWRYAVTASTLLPLPPTSSPQSYPPPTPAAAMWNGALGIGVCGDWCHSSHAGTVEGAWLSARTLAENVITSW